MSYKALEDLPEYKRMQAEVERLRRQLGGHDAKWFEESERLKVENERLRDPEYEAHAEFLEERVGKLSAENERLQEAAVQLTMAADDLQDRLRRIEDAVKQALRTLTAKDGSRQLAVDVLRAALANQPAELSGKQGWDSSQQLGADRPAEPLILSWQELDPDADE